MDTGHGDCDSAPKVKIEVAGVLLGCLISRYPGSARINLKFCHCARALLELPHICDTNFHLTIACHRTPRPCFQKKYKHACPMKLRALASPPIVVPHTPLTLHSEYLEAGNVSHWPASECALLHATRDRKEVLHQITSPRGRCLRGVQPFFVWEANRGRSRQTLKAGDGFKGAFSGHLQLSVCLPGASSARLNCVRQKTQIHACMAVACAIAGGGVASVVWSRSAGSGPVTLLATAAIQRGVV